MDTRTAKPDQPTPEFVLEGVQLHFRKHKEDYIFYLNNFNKDTVKEVSELLTKHKYSHTHRYTQDRTNTIVFTVNRPDCVR